LINDRYGTSRWLAAVFKPASSVSGWCKVMDRVVGFSRLETARSALDQST
jgi:hypothetical protein